MLFSAKIHPIKQKMMTAVRTKINTLYKNLDELNLCFD